MRDKWAHNFYTTLYGTLECIMTPEDIEIEFYVWHKIDPEDIKSEAWNTWMLNLNL